MNAPRSVSQIKAEIGSSLERMIQEEMNAFPEVWSDEERREMAEECIFGKEE